MKGRVRENCIRDGQSTGGNTTIMCGASDLGVSVHVQWQKVGTEKERRRGGQQQSRQATERPKDEGWKDGEEEP